jgi:hypothetical protein
LIEPKSPCHSIAAMAETGKAGVGISIRCEHVYS